MFCRPWTENCIFKGSQTKLLQLRFCYRPLPKPAGRPAVKAAALAVAAAVCGSRPVLYSRSRSWFEAPRFSHKHILHSSQPRHCTAKLHTTRWLSTVQLLRKKCKTASGAAVGGSGGGGQPTFKVTCTTVHLRQTAGSISFLGVAIQKSIFFTIL